MLLHICETCGYWTDQTLSNSMRNIFSQLPNLPPQPQGVACQYGHGYMRQIKPDDKLCIVEKIQRRCDATIDVEVEGKHYKGELYEVKMQ